MGRYPFLEASESYLADVRPFLAPATFAVRRRDLRRLARLFEDLHAKGALSTTNPKLFGEAEIGALIAHMRERGHELTYQAKTLAHLGSLLTHVGNPILERMRNAKIVRLPRRADKPIHVKGDAWFEDAMRKLDTLPGWRREAVRFALAIYYHTGLRVKELRLARLSDLNMSAWTLSIAHPKGEGAWASAGERVAVFPSLRPYVLDFLDARAMRLRDLGLAPETVEPLIPNGSGGYYTDAGWRAMRLKVFREAGIERTAYRTLRPSFAQKLKDRGAPIETVSRALRHSSTATTERFYARIRTERAWDELERIWEAPVVRVNSA
jgi:integrase/recombinase XerD